MTVGRWNWAVCVERARAGHLADLRDLEELHVLEAAFDGAVGASAARGSACEVGLWLGGPSWTRALQDRLDAAGLARTLVVEPPGRLRRRGAALPHAALPAGPTAPLADWIEPRIPPPTLPAAPPHPVSIGLAPSSVARPATLLETTRSRFLRHAREAGPPPGGSLRVALSDGGLALCWGSPLPPLRGSRFVEEAGIAWPCGFRLFPTVSPGLARRIAGADAGDLVVVRRTEGRARVESVARDAFVPVTRATLAALAEPVR